MPQIQIDKLISFSSEDPAYPASNVLNLDPSKKWKCQSPGEKSATLVLQLPEATRIAGVDVGNAGSAYVEILVSRSGTAEHPYKVLLVTSALMSPSEARRGANPSAVRMFAYAQLAAPERDERWDRVKVVCTQPFNRREQYGLGFVKFNSGDGPETVDRKSQETLIGKFAVRSESPVDLFPGSLFNRRKELEGDSNKPLSAAAAIREASSSPSQNSKKINLNLSSRNREELLYEDDEKKPNAKIDALVAQRDRENEARKFLDDLEKEANLMKKKASSQTKAERKPLERNKRKLERKKRTLPFPELLKNVVFTISGIQNPERAHQRTMALAMGAKYKSDWDDSCTHLVCAFVNTPKFNQVKGKGKIVTKQWISDCYNQRKRLPWRRYALDRNDRDRPESEEEILEFEGDDSSTGTNSNSEPEMQPERIEKKFKKNDSSTTDNCDVYNCDTEEEDFYLRTTRTAHFF